MSNGIDAKGYLSGWLSALVNMTSADIKAIPDDKWHSAMGGVTRPTSELVADALSLLMWTTGALSGTPVEGSEEDQLGPAKAKCTTKESAIAALAEAADAFNAALAGASDEALNGVVSTPWGMPTPLFMIAQIAVSHVWYHDGQVNYVQSLLGDEKVHWMGD